MRRLLALSLLAVALLAGVCHASPSYTTNMHLCKPADDDYDFGDCLRGAFDILDSTIAILSSGTITHINANNIDNGTLPNARLDSSSVTLYGPTIPLSALRAGVLPANVIASSIAVNAINSSTQIVAGTISLDRLNQSGCSTNQIPKWNGSSWACATDQTNTTSVPSWTKYSVNYSQFAIASTSNSITLFSLPAAGVIHAIKIKHSTSFKGGAITAYTLDVSSAASNPGLYASPYDVFQVAVSTAFQMSLDVHSENNSNAVNVLVRAAATGANLTSANQGAADIWVMTSITP